jgi:hypothetical protein
MAVAALRLVRRDHLGALSGHAWSCLLRIMAEDRPPAVHGQDGAVDEGGVV